ncbi:MAG: Ig-like domain-containing protein [Verrucomicrobiia bacterium]
MANVDVGNGGDTFSPAVTSIATGDTVIWTWKSGAFIPHAVLSTNSTPAFGSPTPSTSPHAFTNVFSTAGTFHYFCTVHLAFGMTGAVVVASASLPPTIAITNPASGTVFAEPASVTIQASVSGTVTNVQFLVDANELTNEAAAPFSTVAGNLAAGSHTLSAIALDDAGATATNQVAISVVTPVSVLLSAPQPVPPAEFSFSYTANAGLSYIIQRSTNLFSPDWTTLVTNTATSTSIDFTDLNATFNPGFYRVGRLPNP